MLRRITMSWQHLFQRDVPPQSRRIPRAAENTRRLIAILLFSSLLGFFVSPGARAQVSDENAVKAPPAVFQSGGQQRSLNEFRGRKVMLWLFSTWCSSCAVGLEALVENQQRLERAGLQILALQNYKNGGYPGPSINEFIDQYGPAVLNASNWVIGEVPAEMAEQYNPRGYPDIYFLIDEAGMVRAIQGAPASSISTILRFAGVQ